VPGYPKAIIVTGVEYVSGYRIRVYFADGIAKEVELEEELFGPEFEPLRDLDFFRQVRFDPESETAAWPNGADFAPEFLRYGHHTENCPCGRD
jgi:hypothetical protein